MSIWIDSEVDMLQGSSSSEIAYPFGLSEDIVQGILQPEKNKNQKREKRKKHKSIT